MKSTLFTVGPVEMHPEELRVGGEQLPCSGTGAMEAAVIKLSSTGALYDVSRREVADYKFLCDGEYRGCAAFDEAFAAKFRERLQSLIEAQQHSLWWENVLYSMSGAFWGEVDYIEDHERI